MDLQDKIRLTRTFTIRVIKELIVDLFTYYFSAYPYLLILGSLRRIIKRFMNLWFPRGRGRPPVSETVIDLILDMKRVNGWGALRISQELMLLGIPAHKKTVQRILRQNGFIPPKMRFKAPPWRISLKTCTRTWGMDFTTVFDMNGVQVFVLVIIDNLSRELININATFNPTRDWVIQQLRNCSLSDHEMPEIMIIDNDGIYGKWIDPIFMEYFDIRICRIPKKQPWWNSICERFHRSLKEEVFSCCTYLPIDEIQRMSFLFQQYYNRWRPHQGIDGKTPDRSLSNIPLLNNSSDISFNKIAEVTGLITRFELAA